MITGEAHVVPGGAAERAGGERVQRPRVARLHPRRRHMGFHHPLPFF